MKLTSLFHLSLIILAAGLTANLTAAAATVQPSAQSSASAQAEAKEARADHKAPEGEPQPLTLTFQATDTSGLHPAAKFTFSKKENFSILANLLPTRPEGLQELVVQSNPIQVSPAVYEAIAIVAITEKEQTAKAVEGSLTATKDISLEGAMAWYIAYMQAVANKKIKLGQYANLNGAVGACVVKLLRENIKETVIQRDDIIKFLLQDIKLTSIQITTEDGVCNAAQYMFMMAENPEDFCPNYYSLMKLREFMEADYSKSLNANLYYAYLSLLPKSSLFKIAATDSIAEKLSTNEARAEAHKTIEAYKKQWAEGSKLSPKEEACAKAREIKEWTKKLYCKESEKEKQSQAQSATAAKQQPKVAQDGTKQHQTNPAPAEPAQPKNMFTRAKDFFHTYHLARYGAYALVGAAAIYGGYRWYQQVNMRKLARYAGNWA